ncbi:RDH12 [Mytilus edulis]|uniref:RDH12 n=1 Tax=Mytilus edulis TaxID=6550 RepID=A0A8S3UEN6_MYTED|nr:RDH12 [Mytilus edulis]
MENIETIQECVFDHKIALIAISIIIVALWGIRKYIKGAMYNGKRRIDGKTAIITGGNTGIGKETAIDLAKRGAKVIIACRDMTRANAAADDIKRISGSKEIYVRHLDLASLKSVRTFAENIKRTEKRIDILLNNAGVMACPYGKTVDGFEMQFGVNHLGHFLLTNLLLDLIKKSAPSRIINVSSFAHVFTGPLDFDDIAKREKSYSEIRAYSQSKLCNILFTKQLASRLTGTGVTTYSLHPGSINTELARHMRVKVKFIMEALYFIITFFIKTPYEGAQTNIYCAVEESLDNETGKYYSDCAETTPTKTALDDGAAKKLWELSEKLVEL